MAKAIASLKQHRLGGLQGEVQGKLTRLYRCLVGTGRLAAQTPVTDQHIGVGDARFGKPEACSRGAFLVQNVADARVADGNMCEQ